MLRTWKFAQKGARQLSDGEKHDTIDSVGVEMTSSKTYQVLAIPLCPMLPCVPQFKAIGSGNLPTANFHKSLVPWNARQIRLPRVSLGYHTYISCDWRCPKYELQLPTRLWIGIPNSCQDAALCLVFLKQFPSMESHQFLLAKGTSLENCSLIHQRGNQESKKDMAIDISRLWLPFLSASTDARLRCLMLSYAVSCWFASQLSSPPSFWRTKRPRPSDLQRITQLSTNVHDFWKSLDEPFDSLSPGRRAPLLCKIHSDKAIWWCFPFHASWAQKKRFCSFFDSMIPRIFLSQINPAFEVNISAGLSTVLSVMHLLKRIHHPVKHHPHREMPHLLINAWKTGFAPTRRLHHSPGNFDKLSTRECFWFSAIFYQNTKKCARILFLPARHSEQPVLFRLQALVLDELQHLQSPTEKGIDSAKQTGTLEENMKPVTLCSQLWTLLITVSFFTFHSKKFLWNPSAQEIACKWLSTGT